ncbi:hypothetical protein C2S52_000791 [Perilla frutescens var. hirtella]|nr:hypothetical protein C2S52_000791 [Perilla frutescens var. hirtella]
MAANLPDSSVPVISCNNLETVSLMEVKVSISKESEKIISPNDSTTPTQAGSEHIDGFELIGDGKKRKTSVAWNHFKRTIVNGEEKVVCNYCKKKLVEKSRKDLASMIIVHEYPLSMVEHLGFRAFSEGLQSLFKVPCRNTIKSDIMKIYQNEKLKTMGRLEKVDCKIVLTTDLWTASNQKKWFMAITAHYIDDDWKMQSSLLRFMYVECPHTSEALSKVLIECMIDWNIDRKLSTTTLDNCTINDCLVRLLLNKLDSSSLMRDGQLYHMRCCAHILNIIAQEGLSVLGDGIEKVRNSVAFWTAIPKTEQSFRDAACQIKVSISKKLILDCKTRWNSTYQMLLVALAYKDVFIRLKTREDLYKCLPTTGEWDDAKEICCRLEVFNRVTEIFSGTQYPTTNVFFPLICEIKLSLQQWRTCRIEAIRNMASKMIIKFDKYWFVIHGIMGIAIILDPRYKLKLLEYFFPKLYESSSSYEIGAIKKLCYSLFEEYQVKFDTRMVETSINRFSEKEINLDNGGILENACSEAAGSF